VLVFWLLGVVAEVAAVNLTLLVMLPVAVVLVGIFMILNMRLRLNLIV
jgi:hypothetical protein